MGRFAIPGAAAGVPGIDPIGGGPLVLGINKAPRHKAQARRRLLCYFNNTKNVGVSQHGRKHIKMSVCALVIS